jgi:hypothetical protein
MKKKLYSLLAFAAITVTAVATGGCATAASATNAPCHYDSSTNHQDSATVGPDYYSSNDNPFHAD